MNHDTDRGSEGEKKAGLFRNGKQLKEAGA